MTSQPRRPGRKTRTEAGHGDDGSQAQYFKYAGVGVQFAASFLVIGALGWWLDGKLGTSPWLLLAGIFLGATGGFISLVAKVAPASAQPKPRETDRKIDTEPPTPGDPPPP